MIRFEIKDEVVKWVSVNCDLPAALAAELIRQLMTEMSVHNCISVTPAPDATLVEALRGLLDALDRQYSEPR